MHERRLTAKGRATRSRIIEAASQLILIEGVERTRLEDIQAAAGVGASQLYHYFDDKSELIQAVVDYQRAEVLTAQRDFIEGVGTFASLRSWRDAVVTNFRSRSCVGGCPLGSLAVELGESDPRARDLLGASFVAWEGILRGGLMAMVEAGSLPDTVDIDRHALALLAALQGGLLLGDLRRSSTPLEAALDAAIDHLELVSRQLRSANDTISLNAPQDHRDQGRA